MYRELGIPVPVLAEPRYWYERHRTPVIAEMSEAEDHVLVRFESYSFSYGSFSGTCLYAKRGGDWGCYVIKPSASDTIETAMAWLEKRDWEDWS